MALTNPSTNLHLPSPRETTFRIRKHFQLRLRIRANGEHYPTTWKVGDCVVKVKMDL